MHQTAASLLDSLPNMCSLPKEGKYQEMVVNYLSITSITIFKKQTYYEAFSVVGGYVTGRGWSWRRGQLNSTTKQYEKSFQIFRTPDRTVCAVYKC